LVKKKKKIYRTVLAVIEGERNNWWGVSGASGIRRDY
jgi:hypothetical protein